MERFLEEPSSDAALIRRCFAQILDTETDSNLIARFLTKLHESSLDRHPDVIASAVLVLREAALKWPIAASPAHSQGEAIEIMLQHQEAALPSNQKQQQQRHPVCVDIVGTGGDGHNTYNVSTTAAIVAAGVPGIRVIKHGNKASTSSSGSADILASYGCHLQLGPAAVTQLTGSFTFLLAPIWHPALARVAPIRKALPHPTVFNILGPLLNPASIDARIIGVHSPELGRVFAESFAQLSPEGTCVIVCGRERLDEISPAGETDSWWYTPKTGIQQRTITPEMFGLKRHALSTVAGGSPTENADILRSLLAGERQQADAILDYVLLNCAQLLLVAGVASTPDEAVSLAMESITSGRAKAALDLFRDESTAAAATASSA